MAGASPEHNTITSNVHGELYGQLRGKACRPFASNLRLWVAACDQYYYPGVVVVCGDPRYQAVSGMQSLHNPTLIVEVLSESTKAADRGDKWLCYQTGPSLQTYVLVARYRALVEVYQRGEHYWIYTTYEDSEQLVALEVIQCELRLSDGYARVPTQPAQPETVPSAAETMPEENQ